MCQGTKLPVSVSLTLLLSCMLHIFHFIFHVQAVSIGGDVHIDHVACGSAHSIAWSSVRRKLACPLPSRVPMELNHLQTFVISDLRNRLVLLHHFSSLFCKSLTLFTLQPPSSDLVTHEQETNVGYDKLRGLIHSAAKVSCYMCF